MARQTSTIGVSWNASVPMTLVGTCPVMATIGSESSLASARPVTRFSAPGPEVAMTTPGLPVTRAYPSAAKIPPCSWRGRIVRILSRWRVSAWCIGMLAPPG